MDAYIDSTVKFASEFVSCAKLPPQEMPILIKATHAAVLRLDNVQQIEPVVDYLTNKQIAASITPTEIISFENGKSYKSLRCHLRTLGITPENYRRKLGASNRLPDGLNVIF